MNINEMNHKANADLVSVIIPSYNYAIYLERRIQSILDQSYQNIEIIIIDDCSTDNSVEVLGQYSSHPKITLVTRDENGGWPIVNNQGVELSSGDYILFAQCDDTCDPSMIESLVESMRSYPTAGIAFCRSLYVDEKGNVLGEDYDDRETLFKEICKKNVLIEKHEMTKFLFHSCVIPNISAALIRRECFNVVGCFPQEYPICGDWEWFFRVAKGYDVTYIAEPLNKFMQHDKTIRSMTKSRITFEEYFRLLLSNIKKSDLSFLEKCNIRMRIMELWSTHLLSRSLDGMKNFPYHLICIGRLDFIAIIFLPPALLSRMLLIIKKVIGRVV